MRWLKRHWMEGDFCACRSRGIFTLFHACVVISSPIERPRSGILKCADLYERLPGGMNRKDRTRRCKERPAVLFFALLAAQPKDLASHLGLPGLFYCPPGQRACLPS
jgi:hypothetical protein